MILDAPCERAIPALPRFRFRPFLADPKDDLYIDCALAAGADTIVTEDRNFGHPAVATFGLSAIRAAAFVTITPRLKTWKEELNMASVALQIPDNVMQQAQAAAEAEGVPLNQMLLGLIADGVDQQRKLRTMRERATQADVAALLAILDRAPDLRPGPGDESL